jgi:hypothetical protein
LDCVTHPGGTLTVPRKAKKSKKDKGKRDKEKEVRPGKKVMKGRKAKEMKHESPKQSQEPGSQKHSGADDYWDEEDELEEYIMKKDLGQIKDDSDAGSSSACSDSEGALLHLTLFCEGFCKKNRIRATTRMAAMRTAAAPAASLRVHI